MKVLLNVKAYAQLHNTTPQAVYKRITKGTLEAEKKKINGKDVFFVVVDEEDRQGIKESSTPVQPEEAEINPIFNPESTPVQPEEVEINPDFQPQFNPSSTQKVEKVEELKLISFLQSQLEEKDKQLAEKDKQIKEKDKQIEKIQQLLDQEQQLHARTNLLLAEFQKGDEDQKKEKVAAQAVKEASERQEENQEPKKKRSWFYRLFFNEV